MRTINASDLYSLIKKCIYKK
jgi:FlaA1/EpsC-like NDP-sugar epimerase